MESYDTREPLDLLDYGACGNCSLLCVALMTTYHVNRDEDGKFHVVPHVRGWNNPDAHTIVPLIVSSQYIEAFGEEAITDWCRANFLSWMECLY
jgi:hypothetical protein